MIHLSFTFFAQAWPHFHLSSLAFSFGQVYGVSGWPVTEYADPSQSQAILGG